MAYREGAAGLLSENQRIRGLISSVIDIMLLIAAYLLANFLRFNWLPFFEEGGAARHWILPAALWLPWGGRATPW